MVFVLAGLDSLFGQIKEKVFRWDMLKKIKGLTGDETISPELFSLFFTEEILLKGIGSKPCVIVLNKYDTFTQKKVLFHIAREIIKKTGRGKGHYCKPCISGYFMKYGISVHRALSSTTGKDYLLE